MIWPVQFLFGGMACIALSILLWAWLGPAASALMAGLSWTLGVMWNQAQRDINGEKP